MFKYFGSFAILAGIAANVASAAAAVDNCDQVTFHVSGVLSDATPQMYGGDGEIVSDEGAFSYMSLPLGLDDYGVDVRLGRSSDRTWRVDIRQRVGKDEPEPFQGPATNIAFDEKGLSTGLPQRFVFQPASGDVRASGSQFWVVFDGLQVGPKGSDITVGSIDRAEQKCTKLSGVVDLDYPSGEAVSVPLDVVNGKISLEEFLKSQE